MDPKTDALIARTARAWEAPRVLRRAAFDTEAGGLIAASARAGAFGSAPREAMRNLCAAELHERASADVAALLSTHKATSAAPDGDILAGCKNWIAQRIADEADDLNRRMWKPNVASGDTGDPETLTVEASRECESAFAALDSAFDASRRDRVERIVRWATRVLRFVMPVSSVFYESGR